MKVIKSYCLLAVCLLCLPVCLHAQEENREPSSEKKQLPREVPSPEREAQKMTDHMKRELQLTDKQYNKIYKLNLKEQKERFAAMTGKGEQRPPMGPPPEMGGRPPMGGPGGRPPMNRDGAKEMQKAAVAKEKKIKKILTEEQYAKWRTMYDRRDSL